MRRQRILLIVAMLVIVVISGMGLYAVQSLRTAATNMEMSQSEYREFVQGSYPLEYQVLYNARVYSFRYTSPEEKYYEGWANTCDDYYTSEPQGGFGISTAYPYHAEADRVPGYLYVTLRNCPYDNDFIVDESDTLATIVIRDFSFKGVNSALTFERAFLARLLDESTYIDVDDVLIELLKD